MLFNLDALPFVLVLALRDGDASHFACSNDILGHIVCSNPKPLSEGLAWVGYL